MTAPQISRPSAPSPVLGRDLAPPVQHDAGPQCRPSQAGDTGGASGECPGSLTAYRRGCRCAACNEANNERARRNRRRKAMGVTSPDDRMPIQPTYDAVMRLRDLGYTDPQIGRLAGLPEQRIGRIRKGTGTYVSRETTERVASALTLIDRVPPRDLLAARYVDANGARLRVQALITQGWSQEVLGRRLGHSSSYLSPVLYGNRRITRRLHASIAALYDQMWDQRGPSTSAAKRALGRQWATPLELDDDLLDTPGYQPVLHRRDDLYERAVRRDQRQERQDAVDRLTQAGRSASQISTELGISERQVVRERVRLRTAS